MIRSLVRGSAVTELCATRKCKRVIRTREEADSKKRDKVYLIGTPFFPRVLAGFAHQTRRPGYSSQRPQCPRIQKQKSQAP